MLRLAAALLCALTLGPVAAAQPAMSHVVELDYWDPACDEGDRTGETFAACVAASLAEADAELNDAYGEAQERLRADPERGSASGLRTAQRAWIAFRDADCEGALPTWMFMGGGDDWQTGRAGVCKLTATRLRTAELRVRFLTRS